LLLFGLGRRPVGLRLGCWTRLSGAVGLLVLCVLAGGRLGLAGRRRRSLAGGAFVLALALAAEGGRTFPVAKRAGRDVGDGLLFYVIDNGGPGNAPLDKESALAIYLPNEASLPAGFPRNCGAPISTFTGYTDVLAGDVSIHGGL
jgi:hypothetical protein